MSIFIFIWLHIIGVCIIVHVVRWFWHEGTGLHQRPAHVWIRKMVCFSYRPVFIWRSSFH